MYGWDILRALTYMDRQLCMEPVSITDHGIAHIIIQDRIPGVLVCIIIPGRAGACTIITVMAGSLIPGTTVSEADGGDPLFTDPHTTLLSIPGMADSMEGIPPATT